MARKDKTTGFRVTKRQKQLLNEAIEESEWDSKQDYFHSMAIEIIDETGVAADDPEAELDKVREQREQVEDEIRGVKERLKELEDELDDLRERERELENRVEQEKAIGASSYSEALDRLAEHVSDPDVSGITEQAERVENVADEWITKPDQVLQDLWEQCPEVRSDDVTLLSGSTSGWERVRGEDYEEAVELVARWIDRRGEQSYARRQYPSEVAEEHDVDVEELVEDACEELDGVDAGDVL